MIEALTLIFGVCCFLVVCIRFQSKMRVLKEHDDDSSVKIIDLQKRIMSEIQANAELRAINSELMKVSTQLKTENERQKLAIREYGEQVISLEAEVDAKSERIRKLDDQVKDLYDCME